MLSIIGCRSWIHPHPERQLSDSIYPLATCRAVYPKTCRARPPTPNVHHQFMLPVGPFEFGPLLVGRAPPTLPAAAAAFPAVGLPPVPAMPPECHHDHVACLKIANCGRFPAHAVFSLKSEGDAADSGHSGGDAGKGGSTKKGLAAAAAGAGGGTAPTSARGFKGMAAGPPPVQLWPRSMELGLGEAGELRVMAFPNAEGHVQDVIICR